MAGRGRPGPSPKYVTRMEKVWVGRMHWAITARGCPIDVYVSRAPIDVHLRAVRLRRAQKRLPDGVEFVGRYARPFVAQDFLDDVAAQLATPPVAP